MRAMIWHAHDNSLGYATARMHSSKSDESNTESDATENNTESDATENNTERDAAENNTESDAPHPSGSSNYACSHPGVRAKSGSSRPTHARSNACVRACRHVQMLLADMDACASRMNPQLENSCSPCVSLHFSSASLMDRTPNRSSDPGTCYRHAHSSHYSAAT
jgi:hypothetical protein